MYHNIFNLTQKFIWLPQYQAIIDKEHSIQLSKKVKCFLTTGVNVFARSSYIDQSLYTTCRDLWSDPFVPIDKLSYIGQYYTLFR